MFDMNDSIAVRRDNHFSQIPHWVTEAHISDGAFRLYAVLFKYSDNTARTAYPSRATLANKLRKSTKSVDNYVKELVAVGALKVHRRKRKGTKENYTNLYTVITVNPNAFAELQEAAPEQDWEIVEEVGKPVSPPSEASFPETIPSLTTPSSPDTSSNKFDDRIKESDTGEQVRPATKPHNPEGINSTGLTKKQRDPLRNQLVKIGHLMQAGASFQDDSVQDEWYDFGRMVEEAFPDEFDTTGLADIIDNQKSSVDAKCVDPLVAGKRLTSIINTGLAN